MLCHKQDGEQEARDNDRAMPDCTCMGYKKERPLTL